MPLEETNNYIKTVTLLVFKMIKNEEGDPEIEALKNFKSKNIFK